VGTPLWHSLVAGTCGGVIGLTVSHPLDTIRVRMQIATNNTMGLLGTARSITEAGGWRALYRGLAAPCMGYGAINAVAFATDDTAKAVLRTWRGKDAGPLSIPTQMACGALAGVTSSFVRAPVERVKVVMQAGVGTSGSLASSSTAGAVAALVRSRGLVSLYAGTGATIVREVLQYSVYFPSYAALRGIADEAAPRHKWLAVPLVGGIVGSLQWLPPSYCVDVIKSRLQADVDGSRYGSSIWRCFTQIMRTEGPIAFVRGLDAAMLRAFPLHAGVFTGYELTLSMLKAFHNAL